MNKKGGILINLEKSLDKILDKDAYQKMESEDLGIILGMLNLLGLISGINQNSVHHESKMENQNSSEKPEINLNSLLMPLLVRTMSSGNSNNKGGGGINPLVLLNLFGGMGSSNKGGGDFLNILTNLSGLSGIFSKNPNSAKPKDKISPREEKKEPPPNIPEVLPPSPKEDLDLDLDYSYIDLPNSQVDSYQKSKDYWENGSSYQSNLDNFEDAEIKTSNKGSEDAPVLIWDDRLG